MTESVGGPMHANEIPIDADLVRRLVAEQFPHWADLPIVPVPSAGTDNALFRLGDDLAVRLPRIGWAVAAVEKEQTWLPRLASSLPLSIPEPVARGEPGLGYPWPWSVVRWLPGAPSAPDPLPDPVGTARTLARFINALRITDPSGGPAPAPGTGARGRPLAERDGATRQAIAALAGMVDTAALVDVWESALAAPAWQGSPTWFHGDLLPGNLLFWAGKLHAVIDFGTLGVGDPTCDLLPAWNLFAGESRAIFRAELGVDDDDWLRGRGWALSQAVIFIPYYLHTNPVGVGYARRALDQILIDWSAQDG